jgi:hypothetical protein
MQAVAPGKLALYRIDRIPIFIKDVIRIQPREQALFKVHFHVSASAAFYIQFFF